MVAVAKSNREPPQLNRSMKLDWPEKVVIGIAIFIVATMFLFWAVLADGVGSMHDNQLNIALLHWSLETELTFILPIWIVLRTINFITKSYLGWRSRR